MTDPAARKALQARAAIRRRLELVERRIQAHTQKLDALAGQLERIEARLQEETHEDDPRS